MELAELTSEERVVLVALLELVVGSDAHVSEGERDQLERVAAALGDEAYRAAAAEVDRRFRDEAQLRMFVPTISRPGARELIFETVLRAAFPDAIDREESTVLGWLADAWKLTLRG